MWFDQMAIPADAPNPDAAHKFINFIMDAQNSAAATNYVWYASGNKAAQKFIDPEILEYPAVYPDEATLTKLFITTPYDARVQRVVTRLWTKIKSGT
jgi:putrescine transport system substrate-binding protein